MDQDINNIIKDLNEIDPLQKDETPMLTSLVSTLVSLKPDTHFSESFAVDLRQQLLKTEPRPLASPFASLLVSRVFYGVLGSAFTILVAVPLTFLATQKATAPEKPLVFNPFSTTQVKNVTAGLNQKQQISNKGINAFGKIALIPTAEQPSTVVPKSVAPKSVTASVSAVQPKVASSLAAEQGYTYKYTGDELSLHNSTGKVFKRTKGIDSGKQLFELIQTSRFNLSDLSTFSNLSLKNIELSENKPFGYSIAVNFDEGAINIDPQSDRWTSVATSTASLSDTELISIAKQFIQSHMVDMSVYADPVVLSNTDGVVTFPLVLENTKVFDNNGSPFGLTFVVDTTEKKVKNVINLTSQTYDSSQYELETNFVVVTNVATSTLTGPNSGAKKKEAYLGTPNAVLMRYWFTNEKDNTTNELYIPALSFPVTYSDKNFSESLPRTIIVPLVKDFLLKQNASIKQQPPVDVSVS